MTASSPTEWRYDAARSRPLRLLAHGFVAGLGGALLLVGGVVALALPDILPALDLGAMLFVGLLVLVGGPLSLVYLWPMLADADQRPSPDAFAGEDGAFPWTARSTVAAAVAGALSLRGLAAAGVPFDALFALVVALVFSPVVVSLFTTIGTAEPGRLVCNGRRVPLAQVTGVRSVRVGSAVVYWVSYASGTGTLVPRLLTVPAEAADEVRAVLESGVGTPAESPNADPAVRTVLAGSGLLFGGVAVVGARAADDPVVGAYLGGVLGLVGALLCVAAWRGV